MKESKKDCREYGVDIRERANSKLISRIAFKTVDRSGILLTIFFFFSRVSLISQNHYAK